MPLGTLHVTPPRRGHDELALAVLMFGRLAFVLRHVDPDSTRRRRGAFELVVGQGAGEGYSQLVEFSDHLM